jgi:hypothetical protein
VASKNSRLECERAACWALAWVTTAAGRRAACARGPHRTPEIPAAEPTLTYMRLELLQDAVIHPPTHHAIAKPSVTCYRDNAFGVDGRSPDHGTASQYGTILHSGRYPWHNILHPGRRLFDISSARRSRGT